MLQKASKDIGLQQHACTIDSNAKKGYIVVIIRAHVRSDIGRKFTDDRLHNMRSHDDIAMSEKLIEKIKKKFGNKYAVKTFFGNITMIETSQLFASAIAVIGATGAGFSNLIFARPSTVVLIVISKEILEYITSQNKNVLSSHIHTGVALKLGMTPRMIIAENLIDEKYYPFEIIINELEKRLS